MVSILEFGFVFGKCQLGFVRSLRGLGRRGEGRGFRRCRLCR